MAKKRAQTRKLVNPLCPGRATATYLDHFRMSWETETTSSHTHVVRPPNHTFFGYDGVPDPTAALFAKFPATYAADEVIEIFLLQDVTGWKNLDFPNVLGASFIAFEPLF